MEAFFEPSDWGTLHTKVGPATVKYCGAINDSVIVAVMIGDTRAAIAQIICKPDHVEFLDICVEPAYQGRGIHRGLRTMAAERSGKPWWPSLCLTPDTLAMYAHEGIEPREGSGVKPYLNWHPPGLRIIDNSRSIPE